MAEWDPYSEPIIAEQKGRLKFEDIIPGVTAVEQFDEVTGDTRLELNEYIPAAYKPAIILATEVESLSVINLILNRSFCSRWR